MKLELRDIEAAARRIADAVKRTPFEKSRTLSEMLGAELYIKFENMHFTATFKERGALNKLLQLQSEAAGGVIAMSAGNHAKAVAYHAQRLAIPATIVMPRHTPNVKVQDTRNFGARVVLHGDGLDEAAVHARELADQEGLTFIHPFDDIDVIAGQGTVALEMLEAQPELEALIVPIGGGGLISGAALAAKSIKPAIEVIGVESAGYAGVDAALHGTAIAQGGPSIAEGIAVKQPSTLTLELIRRHVDDVVVVSEEEIEEAVSLYLSIEKTVAEGAGAATLAAACAFPDRFAGRKVGIILSGGNIDSRILASVLMRHLVRTRRLVRFRLQISDVPGVLAKVTAQLGELGGNILEVSHHRTFGHAGVTETDLDVTLETRDAEHTTEILEAMEQAGYAVSVLD